MSPIIHGTGRRLIGYGLVPERVKEEEIDYYDLKTFCTDHRPSASEGSRIIPFYADEANFLGDKLLCERCSKEVPFDAKSTTGMIDYMKQQKKKMG